MWANSQNPADFVTFPERILNGKLHFLYSARVVYDYNLQKIFFPTVITQGWICNNSSAWRANFSMQNFEIKKQNVPWNQTVSYGIESILALVFKIWNLISFEIKNIEFFYQFKEKISTWSAKNCPCHVCKTYI